MAEALQPFRAYVVGDATTVPVISTGVENAACDGESPEEEIYNLQGVRLSGPASSLPSGIYIINAKTHIKN